MALIIVTGPPASGKSTWVRDHARPNDIVIDYDVLAQALSGPGADTHRHGKQVRSVAHQARSTAIAQALRYVSVVDVYIIHTEPQAEAVAKYRRHQARWVTIDPGRDVVMLRCRELRSPHTLRVVEDWYATQASRSLNVNASSSREW